MLADEAGLTVSEYVRSSALKERKSPINTDKKVIRECRVELARQGNNLNQIARKLNTSGVDPNSVHEIRDLHKLMEATTKLLYEIAHRAVNK